MQETRGSTRADLVGGTLDLFPLNLQIPDVVTINMALSLKAKVLIEKANEPGVLIISSDYNREYYFDHKEFTKESLYFSDHFGKMTFVAQILSHCDLTTNIKMTLSSGAPAGSGLGGSSAMGVTLYKAIKNYQGKPFDRIQAISEIQQIEAGILKAGVAGYQDYYPALFGGVLALHPAIGRERIEQLSSDALKSYLEAHVSLIYSGVSRDSGINNWEVYKKFYDKDVHITQGLYQIAKISTQAYLALKKNHYKDFLDWVIQEGIVRSELFPSILGEKITSFKEEGLSRDIIHGVKICGAGGGGCFLVIHESHKKMDVEALATKHDMEVLEFQLAEIIP